MFPPRVEGRGPQRRGTFRGKSTMTNRVDPITQHLDHVWPPYLPCGCLTVLSGMPFAGKSMALLSVAAALTAGRPLPGEPDGQQREPVNVSWWSPEDNTESIVAPRFAAAEADLSRINVLNLHRDNQLNNPAFLIRFDQACARHRMVVLDPVHAFPPGIGINNAKKAQRLLQPLADIAQQHPDCAPVLINNFRKGGARTAIGKVGGSVQQVAAVRSICIVARQHTAGRTYYFAHADSCLAPVGATRTFSIQNRHVYTSDGHGMDIGTVEWGETVDLTADDLVRMSGERQGRGRLQGGRRG